jgi:hypothetical protein
MPPDHQQLLFGAPSLRIEADMGNWVFKGLVGIVAALVVGPFLKGAWDNAQKEAEEAAHPPFRWTDKNRWE